jgi:hypothetical protein
MNKLVLIGVAAIALSGCSLIAPKIGPQVAKGVNRYCAEPYAERLVIRQTVNAEIAPNKITVTCEGDPQ